MIKASKKEAMYLVSKGYGYGEYIHTTVGSGKKRTYYITEDPKLISDLNQFRSNTK